MSENRTTAEKAAREIQSAYDDACRADSGGQAAVNLEPLAAHIQAAIDERTKPLVRDGHWQSDDP